MMLRSFGSLPLKKHGLFPGLDLRGNYEKIILLEGDAFEKESKIHPALFQRS